MKRLSMFAIGLFALSGFLGPQAMAQQGMSQQKEMSKKSTSQQGMQIEKDKEWRSSQITGMEVHSKDGQKLGKVKDIVFDTKGEISYLVVARNDNEYVPVPWKNASPQKQQNNLVISVNQNEFKDAPSFSANQWPQFDKKYERQVTSYYGEKAGTSGNMQQKSQQSQQREKKSE